MRQKSFPKNKWPLLVSLAIHWRHLKSSRKKLCHVIMSCQSSCHVMLCLAIYFQYFVVDESTGRLLVQGKDQKEATEFANLLLSNVKTCDELEVDRNFCFQVSQNGGPRKFLKINTNVKLIKIFFS